MKTNMSPAERKAVLERRQHGKMAESAHAYVRGNTVRFYDWLRSDAEKALPHGPDLWICGDCHTGNIGPIADVHGHVDIQIRDLDQTVIGNPAHDLLRLGLSLAMAARSSDLPGITTALMLEEVISGYLIGLTGRSEHTLPEEIEPIRRVMRQSRGRRWRHLAEERLQDVTPSIPLGRKYWSLTKDERAEIEALAQGEELLSLLEHVHGSRPDELSIADAAYWMKGCSSLGLLRYAVLVKLDSKKRRSYHLLDFKQAVQAAAPSTKSKRMPRDNAERVREGAKNLSPYLGERIAAVKVGGRSVFVRELKPQDMKFELVGLQQREAISIARLMAGVVGRAHGRQMDSADRRAWASDLKKRHGKGIDAPRWLWSGVVDLAALHEAAYLEHCRRYAQQGS
jgi:uncharacterized protein (DUF2252 family)